jgi:hypothetical protein
VRVDRCRQTFTATQPQPLTRSGQRPIRRASKVSRAASHAIAPSIRRRKYDYEKHEQGEGTCQTRREECGSEDQDCGKDHDAQQPVQTHVDDDPLETAHLLPGGSRRFHDVVVQQLEPSGNPRRHPLRLKSSQLDFVFLRVELHGDADPVVGARQHLVEAEAADDHGQS